MAKRQEAEPDASAALPNESADSGSKTPAQASGDAAPAVEPSKLAIGNDLPVFESPRLDTTESAPPVVGLEDQALYEPADAPAAAPAPARTSRFALLAAAVALAAALGSVVGSLSATGFVHLWSGASGRISTADANAVAAIRAEIAELTALKADLDGATRNANGQFAKIADRLDRVEHAQADPATKLAHIADAIDRLDKRASSDITGSIASSQPPAPAAPEAKTTDRILQDWIVQDVQNGRALVESRYGGVFDVASGSTLPGVGRVEAIKRQDGQWVVVTARGLITSNH